MSGERFDQEGWTDLERALRQRGGPESSAALETRILTDVRRALCEPAQPVVLRWTGAARWAAVAAVLIVGLALSQMAASVTAFFNRPVRSTSIASVRAAADLMRQVSPGLTTDEADRLALASAWRSELPAMPMANADSRPAARDLGLNIQGDIR
jgi:hypothetical protein